MTTMTAGSLLHSSRPRDFEPRRAVNFVRELHPTFCNQGAILRGAADVFWNTTNMHALSTTPSRECDDSVDTWLAAAWGGLVGNGGDDGQEV